MGIVTVTKIIVMVMVMAMAIVKVIALGFAIVIVKGILLYLRNFICFLSNVGCRWGLGWNSGGRVGRWQ